MQTPDSNLLRFLTGQEASPTGAVGDMTDAWNAWTGSDETNTDPGFTFSTLDSLRKRIDFVLMRSGAQVADFKRIGAESSLYNERKFFPSDHLGISMGKADCPVMNVCIHSLMQVPFRNCAPLRTR